MMYRFSSTLCFAIFAFFITFSEQRLVYYLNQNADWKSQALYHQIPIGISPYVQGIPVVTHKPKLNTYLYRSYNSGPTPIPVSHNLPGWPHQTYQGHLLLNGLQFNNQPMIRNLSSRTLRFLKPSSYSQYQPAIPQVYSYPRTYPVHSYDYSTPLIPRYTGIGDYSPYFRSTAEEKVGQWSNPWTSDKFNPFQSSFGSPQKPFTSPTIPRELSPRMLPAFIPNTFQDPLLHQPKHQPKNIDDDNHFKIIPATFGFTTLSELRKREMQGIPHTPLLNQPQLNSIAEEYKPKQWNLGPIGQPMSFNSAHGHRQIRDLFETSVPKSSEENGSELREDWYHTLAALNKLIENKDTPKNIESTLVKKEENMKTKDVNSGKKYQSDAEVNEDSKVGAIFSSLGSSFKNT